MVEQKKKKGIYSIPISSEELFERVLEYLKTDGDFSQAHQMIELSKKEPSGNLQNRLKIRNAKVFKAGLEIGVMLAFFHMGGHDEKGGIKQL